MSDNGYGWKKRQVETVTCPSGAKCVMRRAGQEVGLRGAQLTRIFQKLQPPEGQEVDPQLSKEEREKREAEEAEKRLEGLTADEFTRLVIYAKDLVVASVVKPRIVLHPSPGNENEIGPDDIDTTDFWFLFGKASEGMTSIPVKTVGGETTVEAVETFSQAEGSSADAGSDGGADAPIPVSDDGNTRPDNSDSV